MDSELFNGELNGFFAALGAFLIVFLIIFIAILVFYIIANWKLYKKAGKNGWESIVPIYGTWVFVDIAGLAWWWFLIMLGVSMISITNSDYAPILRLVSLFCQFCCYYNISKKLHKDTGFAILMTLFPIVMVPIVAFSNSYQFDQTVEVSELGPFGGNKDNNGNTNTTNTANTNGNNKFCSSCGSKVDADNDFCPNCGAKLK